MKITYAKFKNFAGIYAGLGKKELVLDFTTSENKIVFLLGKNGSGKTVVMSLLTPLRESTDNRKNLILEGQEGYKEIRYILNNDLYIIKHFYGSISSKNKSYISKNNIELNNNGGIKSFYTVLEKEFNLNKDYFTIGKLGSDITGFIGRSTADRKTYINKFVPNIDIYLEGFEKINSLYKSYNKDIISLKEMINEIDKDSLLLEKSKLNNSIKKLNNINNEYNNILIIKNNKLNNIKNKINLPDNFEENYNNIKNDYELSLKTKESYIETYPALKTFDIDKIENKCNSNTLKINLLNNNNENIKNNIIFKENNINSLKENLLKIDNNIETAKEDFIEPDIINEEINNLNTEIKDINTSLTKLKNEIQNKVNINIDENILNTDLFSNRLNEKNIFFKNIETIKAEYSLNIIEETDINKESNYLLDYKNINNKNKILNNELEKINKKIFYIDSSREKYEKILSNKPLDCISTTCAFIREAQNFKNNILPEYSILINDKKEKENILENNNNALDILENKINFIKDIKKYIFDKNNDFKFLPMYINIYNNFKDIIENTNQYEETIMEEISKINKYLSLTSEYKEKNNILSMKLSLLNINKSKELLINQYNIEKQNILEKISNLENEISNDNFTIEENDHKIKVMNNTMNCLIKLKEVLLNIEDKENIYNINTELYNNNILYLNEINNLENEIYKYTELYNDNQKEIDNLTESLDNIKNNLFLYKTYSSKLNVLENDIQDLSIIKDSLDPKKGIPLIFMKNYLNSIAKEANDLLDKAYNGDFKIKFEITSKEFLIKVYKSNGTVLEDIQFASQGEISLTTISLSLAMINVIFNECKYNILYLDEIDGALDKSNRKKFLSILDKQLENKFDQCFIISHNEEFFSNDIDMILLKDNNIDILDEEFMLNKNIIFNINQK